MNNEPHYPHTLFGIKEVHGIYIDAVAVDAGENLLFLSCWADDTALQQFLAQLSLPAKEGGLQQFQLQPHPDQAAYWVYIKNGESLKSASARMPNNSIFSGLTQCWIYDSIVMEPNKLARRAVALLREPDPHKAERRVWKLAQQTCSLPLMDHWQSVLMPVFRKEGWIKSLKSIGLNALQIDFSDPEVERVISHYIQLRALELA